MALQLTVLQRVHDGCPAKRTADEITGEKITEKQLQGWSKDGAGTATYVVKAQVVKR